MYKYFIHEIYTPTKGYTPLIEWSNWSECYNCALMKLHVGGVDHLYVCVILYFLVIRRISLISAYSLLSTCLFSWPKHSLFGTFRIQAHMWPLTSISACFLASPGFQPFPRNHDGYYRFLGSLSCEHHFELSGMQKHKWLCDQSIAHAPKWYRERAYVLGCNYSLLGASCICRRFSSCGDINA